MICYLRNERISEQREAIFSYAMKLGPHVVYYRRVALLKEFYMLYSLLRFVRGRCASCLLVLGKMRRCWVAHVIGVVGKGKALPGLIDGLRVLA